MLCAYKNQSTSGIYAHGIGFYSSGAADEPALIANDSLGIIPSYNKYANVALFLNIGAIRYMYSIEDKMQFI